ncbi:ATP-dependent protease La, partial [Sporormia fimetaria CBS 119925]
EEEKQPDAQEEAVRGPEAQGKHERDQPSNSPEPIPPPKSSHARGTSGAESKADNESAPEPPKPSDPPSVKPPGVPDIYPQLMAVPLVRKPVFPGSYKTLTIKDKEVGEAIAELVRKSQPYVATFLLKDDKANKDVIDDPKEVYDVGSFCQIVNVIVSASTGVDYSMNVTLYPHRKIKLSSLQVAAEEQGKDSTEAPTVVESTLGEEVLDEAPQESQGDVVASFEETTTEPQPDSQLALLKGRKVSIVNVENLTEEPFDTTSRKIEYLVGQIIDTFKQIVKLKPQHFAEPVILPQDPVRLTDLIGALAGAPSQELQETFEDMNMESRLLKALALLKGELVNAEQEAQLDRAVGQKANEGFRRHLLQSKLEAIKQELGMDDKSDYSQYTEKADKLAMPPAVRKAFDEELGRLKNQRVHAQEVGTVTTYLDTLVSLPWGKRTVENFNVKHARTVLDEDHYGLQDVKDRILESIAVGKLRGAIEGKILCLVGPPGVGKTSIGKSIARALNRQYQRISLGGVHDASELKGHRRTYVGAMPGRITRALKSAGSENPLILLDEVDKLGRMGMQGDISATMLELLDPAQNNAFLDQYLDVPLDLSKVLFVCTANLTDTISRPLLDRMEVIQLSGYVADEKLAIAERYLVPAAKESSGLKDADVVLEKDAILDLINRYTRESGVRKLKQQIEKVYRKAAMKVVTDLGEEALPESEAITEEGEQAQQESEKTEDGVNETPEQVEKATTVAPRVGLKIPESVHVSIAKDNLKDYVGPPKYTSDRLYDSELTPPGVVMGLVVSDVGGFVFYVESILESALSSKSQASLERTGSMKSVMQESAQVAYSFAKGFVAREFPKNRFLQHAKVHMHCPEGATPKEGPSAGIAMATSLLSLALDVPVTSKIAMTGELTVTGKVLPIGGLREKTVGAKRSGAKTIIFPQDNLADWLELPDYIKEGVEGKPVSWYKEVFELVFPGIDR